MTLPAAARRLRAPIAFLVTCTALVAAGLLFATPALAEGPDVTEAQGWIVEDSAGNVLAEKNADARFEPASITKVMTAMLALDSGLSFDTQVTIPELPAGWEYAQVAGYEPGSKASLGDLLKVMLVYSANDAALAVAHAVGGSEQAFVSKMNEKAKALGMKNTVFKNPHGMSQSGHESCARDLATMGRYALSHYPFIAQMVRTHSVTVPVNGVPESFVSTDQLMPVYSPLLGIKTGKCDQGTTFLGAARSNGVELYSCVLACSTDWGRFQDTLNMFQWAYDTYSRRVFAKEGSVFDWQPFAFRFGYVVPVIWDQTASGYLWPGGAPCTYKRYVPAHGQLARPNALVGASRWEQGGRPVAAATLSTGPVQRGSVDFGGLSALLREIA